MLSIPNRVVIRRAHPHFVDTDRLLPVQTALLPPPSTSLSPAPNPKHDISRFPIGTLVALALEHDLVSLRRAARDLERVVRGVLADLVPAARGARARDDLPTPAALVARLLRLCEHAREYLLLHDPDTASAAPRARVDVPVGRGTGATAVIAQNALLDHELSGIE